MNPSRPGTVAPMPLRDVVREIVLPLRDGAPLMLMGLASVAMTAGLALLRSPMLLISGVILLVFMTSAFMKYATRVLAARAAGLDVPAADLTVFDYFGDVWALYPWLAWVLVTAAGLWVGRVLGDAAVVVFALAVGAFVPAAVAAAAVTRRFTSQFRVPGLLRVMRLLGRDYAMLLVAWLTLAALTAWLRGFAPTVVAVFAGCFQTLASFNLTGAVLFRHREALDLPVRRESRVVREANAEAARRTRDRGTVLNHAYGLISRGNAVGGLQHIRTYLEREEEGADGWEWFLSAMRGWDPPTARLGLARDYLGALRHLDDGGRAVALLEECVAELPSFRPHAADREFVVGALLAHDRAALAAEMKRSAPRG